MQCEFEEKQSLSSNKFEGEELLNEKCNPNLQEIVTTNINHLNTDCLMHIFLYLPIKDRVRVGRVCKQWLEASRRYWKQVRSLKLKHISEAHVFKLLYLCSRIFLKEIYLYELHYRRKTLNPIGDLFSNLEVIDITLLPCHIIKTNKLSLSSLIRNCHKIKKLTLCYLYPCETELKELFKVNPKLQYFKLVSANITGNCISYLPLHMIQEIFIQSCPLDIIQMEQAILKFIKLRCLVLLDCTPWITNIVRTLTMHCKDLKIFGIRYEKKPYYTSELPSLVSLECLKVNLLISDFCLEQLNSQCQRLTYLDISDVPGSFIENKTLQILGKLPKLEILITCKLFKVTMEGLLYLCNLKQLVCRECTFDDEAVSSFIFYSPRLEVLDLTGCSNITNDILPKATEAIKYRTKTILTILVTNTAIDLKTFKNESKYLHVKICQRVSRFPLEPISVL